jgi:hypothetical protein
LRLLSSTFQQAVVRNVNDKIAQLQKQFENVVREGIAIRNIFLPITSPPSSKRGDQPLERKNWRYVLPSDTASLLYIEHQNWSVT